MVPSEELPPPAPGKGAANLSGSCKPFLFSATTCESTLRMFLASSWSIKPAKVTVL